MYENLRVPVGGLIKPLYALIKVNGAGGKYPNKDFHKNILSLSDNGYARWSVTLTILAMVVDERPSMWPWLYTVPASGSSTSHPAADLASGTLPQKTSLGQWAAVIIFFRPRSFERGLTTWPLWGCCFHRTEVTCSKWQAATSCRKRPRKKVGGAYCHRMKFLNKSFDNKLLGALSPIILQEKGIHSPCKTRTHCTAYASCSGFAATGFGAK